MTRVNHYLKNQVARDFILKNTYHNIQQVPKFTQITLSLCLNLGGQEEKMLTPHFLGLEKVSHQKPKKTYAKKSIAEFTIRKGQVLGCKVNLRGPQLYELLDTLIVLVFPQIPDFGGISTKSFQNDQSLTLGFSKFAIFPEVERDFEILDFLKGLNITITTTAKNQKELTSLLSAIRFPLV